jgi:hypothetical protein
VVAPRGHAKTTLVSFIYPLHQMLFGEEDFVLLISESETQSKYLLEAIGNEIEYNKKVHEYFGNRMGETWGKEEKEVITGFDENGKPSGMCKVLIRGTGQKVRSWLLQSILTLTSMWLTISGGRFPLWMGQTAYLQWLTFITLGI